MQENRAATGPLFGKKGFSNPERPIRSYNKSRGDKFPDKARPSLENELPDELMMALGCPRDVQECEKKITLAFDKALTDFMASEEFIPSINNILKLKEEERFKGFVALLRNYFDAQLIPYLSFSNGTAELIVMETISRLTAERFRKDLEGLKAYTDPNFKLQDIN